MRNIRLPSTLNGIEARTFESCKSLKSIEIPKGVECIGEYCFCDSGIEEVSLSNTLKEIGKEAFKGCENLKIVWVGDDFALDLANVVRGSVKILSRLARVGSQLLLDIRKIK